MTAPWLGWAPPPIQKPSGTEGLGQMLQALGQMRQQQLFAQDLQNLKVHQDAVNASGVTEPAPSPRSRQMQQMMGQGMLQNLMMANQPMTRYQQAQIGISNQQAQFEKEKFELGPRHEATYYDAKGNPQKVMVHDGNRDKLNEFLTKTGGTWHDPQEKAYKESEEQRKIAGESRAEADQMLKASEELRKIADAERSVQAERRAEEAHTQSLLAAARADREELKANNKAAKELEFKIAAERRAEESHTNAMLAAARAEDDPKLEGAKRDLAYRTLLEEQEKAGTLDDMGEAELRKIRVPGSPQTNVTVNTGDARQTAELDAADAVGFQDKVDEMNMGTTNKRYRWEVQTGTKGERHIAMAPKSVTQLATMDAFNDISRRAKRARELWKPGFTGMVEGTDFARKFKEKTGLMAPDEVEWRQNQDALIKLLYAEAGKQLSDREIAIHFKRFPRSDVQDDVYDRQLNEFLRNLQLDIEARQGGAKELPSTATGNASNQQYQEGVIYENPNTGKRVILRGGKWQPIQ